MHYLLYVDINRCTGCHACEVACRQEYGDPLAKWRIRLMTTKPRKIDGRWHMYFIPVVSENCTGCESLLKKGEKPACIVVCPTEAIKCSEDEELIRIINKGKPVSILRSID